MGLALLFTVGAAAASGVKPTKDDVFNTYLSATVHGKLNGIEDVIDDDAEFNIKHGDNVHTLSKEQIIGSLKSAENLHQACRCTKSVVQDGDDVSMLKVEMKYADFTRVDVITAQRAWKGWKITRVDISYV